MANHIFEDVRITRHAATRRRFLKTLTAVAVATGGLGFRDLMAVEAANLRKRGKAMILLWMQGGPSQFETFYPKPGIENGGPTEAIQTGIS